MLHLRRPIPPCLHLVLVLLMLLPVAAAWGEDGPVPKEVGRVVLAAGDGSHLWVVAGDELLHAELGEEVPRLTVAADGLDDDGGGRALTSRGATAWLVESNGRLREVTATRSPSGLGWRYESTPRAAPPEGATVRAMAHTGGELWALLRVEDTAALRALLGSGNNAGGTGPADGDEAARLRAAIALGLPPDADLPAWVLRAMPGGEARDEGGQEPPRIESTDDDPPASAPAVPTSRRDISQSPSRSGEAESDADADAPPPPPPPLPLDVLARLEGSTWAAAPLPRNWPHGARAAVLGVSETAGTRPTLVVTTDASDRDRRLILRVYRPLGETGVRSEGDREGAGTARWESEAYRFGDPSPASVWRWSAVAVDGQVVVTLPAPSSGGGAEDFQHWVLWGQSATSPGSVAMDYFGRRAAVTNIRGAAVVVALQGAYEHAPDDRPVVHLRGLDLYGQPYPGPEPAAEVLLYRQAPDRFGKYFQWVLLAAVLAMSGLLLILFWLRDPRTLRLSLGPGVEIAPLWPRFLAGVIDLAVPVWVVLRVYGLALGQLPLRWPGVPSADSWQAIQPGALAIALLVVHTLIGELIWSRSLGKALIGLRVSGLHGRRPRVWQVLVRCVLKAFDLVALPLLLLVPLNPYRQRMGDLIARTVVVREISKESVK